METQEVSLERLVELVEQRNTRGCATWQGPDQDGYIRSEPHENLVDILSVVHAIAPYNEFNYETVRGLFFRMQPWIVNVSLGYEGSPVMYVELLPGYQDDPAYNDFIRYPDEFDIDRVMTANAYGNVVVRMWWD